jgi:hypothetical protein
MSIDAGILLLHLRVVGIAMAVLVAINVYVPRRFHWREEMTRVSLVNRQIFTAHAVFLALTLALTSALLIGYADALVQPSPLSRAILLGLTIFWTARMVMQWGFYSPDLWRGNRFNTFCHYLFSALWVYMSTVFVAAFWTALG